MHFYQQKMFKDSIHLPYSYVDEAMEAFKEVHFDFSKDIDLSTSNEQISSKLQLPLTAPLFETEAENAEGHGPGIENSLKPGTSHGENANNRPMELNENSKHKRQHKYAHTSDRNLRSANNKLSINNASLESNDHDDYLAFFHETFIGKTTVGKALHSSDASQWIDAMRAEILLLLQHTLEPVEYSKLPSNKRIIHSTMQLKLKKLPTGVIDKYKARLCACGNELWSNTAETYSPTIGALAYATVHQLAIIDQMVTCTVDTVGAYLYADYPADALPLFLTLPSNVAIACGLDPAQHYRIRKYLYGLPDSGRAYYRAYSKHLESHGYTRTVSDPCLFT
jgi:hypothetical protein